MNELKNDSVELAQAKLLGSLLLFTRYFYEVLTKREFGIVLPTGRESRHHTICRELTSVSRLQTKRLMINIPPGMGKSTHISLFIPWCLAKYPHSKFIYISHSSDLAVKHTSMIKQIIELPQYKELFGIELLQDSKARDNFGTNKGGRVVAFGAKGSITGHDAGLPFMDVFSGAIIIDDIHKPDEAHSDVVREFVKRNYSETIKNRLRADNVPIVFIGQRLHEDDLPANLIRGFDGEVWKTVILKAVDEVGNILAPEVASKEKLDLMAKHEPYVFASQYQQDPMPAGGALFKRDNFVLLEIEPDILQTFITVDTAETEKTYNDATVFTFFGLYKINEFGIDSDIKALHVIDCWELWVEPKDLESSFRQFYSECLRHPVKPRFSAIEKKSTGSTLISVIRQLRGIHVVEIPRTSVSGSKTERFLRVQPFVNKKLISFPANGKHTQKCIDHLVKITANNTHRYDDIADTISDGVQLALIDKVVSSYDSQDRINSVIDKFNEHNNMLNRLTGQSWQSPMHTRIN